MTKPRSNVQSAEVTNWGGATTLFMGPLYTYHHLIGGDRRGGLTLRSLRGGVQGEIIPFNRGAWLVVDSSSVVSEFTIYGQS